MSARRISEKQISIPENAHFLDFERSDGDPKSWPTNTTRIVDEEGHVNFMQPLTINDPASVRWRIGVAQGIAAALKLPEGPEYVLRDWPAGYAFFDHHKGISSAPRHDVYLFGRAARRFRSINEFIPHAIWLKQDPTLDTSNCACKYCQKKPQKDVTASLPPGILRPSHGPSPTPSRPRLQREKPRTLREAVLRTQRESKVYAAVQKVLLPVLTKSPNVHPKHTMLVERNADLRAVVSKTAMKLKRWFRAGELLWCALDPPILGKGDIVIKFWPGIVDEVKLKTKSIPVETDSTYSTATQLAHENDNDGDVVLDDLPGSVPWSVSQSSQYRIQLLAVNHSYLASDDQVLPYQAHVPSNDLISALIAFPPERLNFDRDVLTKFNPCPKGKTAIFEDAVAPYAMAVQIGSVLSGFWCLTDEWAFEYTIPERKASTSKPDNPASSADATSLQAAIEAANVNNSQSNPPSSPLKYYPNSQYYSVSSSTPGTPTQDLQRLSVRMVGKAPTPGPVHTQMRFQGLWWGAERIWTDDFVRLKVPRRCLAPKGAENILPPSPPGKSAVEIYLESGQDPSELGAGARGVFMRLDGLFVVDAGQADGTTKKECRASGMLYELADHDWEDPNVVKGQNGTTNSVNGSSATSTNSDPPPSFVPAPSPLNPHVLPNVDPSVPVASTSSAMLAQTGPPAPVPSIPLPSSQLSHPSAPHYLLPEPPEGYVFRPILTPGHEVVVSLSLISGRYYPKILSHPLLAPRVKDALENPLENGGLQENNNLWALEGLAAGYYNAVDPTIYKTSRTKMIEDADKAATRQLEDHKRERLEAEDESMKEDEPEVDELAYPDDAMDVDR
ncbi:hypothetical protein Hypma_012012 [Hypsizygus marmoreus]|uniref:Cryptic loci regulator 2 N-terminal domain-containing protein n=1 Tax=Hypsizygus marmoreus TaxID=39966 RepID=A0A369JJT2_HYPMA|nr:hypothetical protein Hypma_012012 [Hypsizygus marmoreus]